MAVRITNIRKDESRASTDSISKHVAITSFRWINEQTQESGESTRDVMYDWVVNKKGVAYVQEGGNTVYVYGAISPSGTRYLRTVSDGIWKDNLLQLNPF